MVRKLLALAALTAVATSGAALAATPGKTRTADVAVAAALPAVEIAPDLGRDGRERTFKDHPDCGGVGFTKVVITMSRPGFMCRHNAADSFTSTADALELAHPTAASRGPATAKVPCYGDGQTGSRVQMIYGYPEGKPNRSKVVVDQVRRLMVPRMQAVFKNQSAGRDLSMRFAFTKGCKAVDVKVIKFPARVLGDNPAKDPGGQLDRVSQTLDAMGYNRADRKYHVLWDGWNNAGVCGIGYLIGLDPASSLPYSLTNQGLPTLGGRTDVSATGVSGRDLPITQYSLTFNHVGSRNGPSCFFGRGLSTVSTVIHEILHTMGAVQLDAPHADTGHCTDAPSVMCSGGAEGYGLGTQIKACTRVLVETLDCGMDDYWSPEPLVTDYLATHYNIAETPFFGPQLQDNLAASPL